MLRIQNISLQRGGNYLLRDASLTLHRGNRIGVIGKNGCGKSSLLATVTGEISVESGNVSLSPSLTIAHVDQEMPSVSQPILEYVIDGDQELRRIQGKLIAAEEAHDGVLIAELHHNLDLVDGYSAPHKAKRLLAGLGFPADCFDQDLATLSGGWQMRLKLARALMCRSDVLLLDEPTNHLDLDTLLWLEQWLRQYAGILILISHDRDFLDGVVNRIALIENHSLTEHTGNYSQFESQYAQDLIQQKSQYEKQQNQIRHMQAFVERFKAKATKARQAQSRVKALERMQTVASVQVESPFQFSFASPEKLPNPLLEIHDASIGYDEKPVLDNIELKLMPGDRVALLGANGAGKSSLIKVLAGEQNLTSGTFRKSKDLRIGYFAQHHLDLLDTDASALAQLTRLTPNTEELKLRKHLGHFGFQGDAALREVATFSGGEKSRLILALIVWQRPNILLLDEPTNHLDLKMREALTYALQDFTGAVVLVSHDRHLLRSSTDQFLLVAAGQLQEFNGDLEDYRVWLNSESKPDDETAPKTESRKDLRRQSAARRKELEQQQKPLKRRIAEIDKALIKAGLDKEQIDRQLSDPAQYQKSDSSELEKLLIRQADRVREIEALETEWIELSTELEDQS